MDADSISRFLATEFPDMETRTDDGNLFFFVGVERNFPFATLVASDKYDTASELGRTGVFRLNIGVGRDTFRSLFPEEAIHDFTTLDHVMPHPVYGGMFWVCVLCPSDDTFEKTVRPLLAEARELAAGRQAKQA